jgi:probable rRNA maturation factor
MGEILFFYKKISFRLKNPRKAKAWINNCVKTEGATIQELRYIFCSDRFLHQLNQQYLHHNTLTDIITFDFSEHSASLEGEIYISITRIRENARKFHVSFDQELARVMIHGVLHLLRFNDKKPAEKALMRKKEEACLSLRK